MNEQLFTGKSGYYEMSRPKVSQSAVDYLCSIVPPDAVFADIGAGTGKFTSLIAERDYAIYAVEPNSEMHMVLKNKLSSYSNVKILNTSAEKTEIPSKSVDVIVAVTALHWFDLDAFRTECLRILKPGGFVVAIYNSRKSEIEKKAIVHSEKTATEIFFGENCDIVMFPNKQTYSREQFIAYHLSHSSAPNIGDDKYSSYIKEVNSLFDKNSVNGSYVFDFISILYIGRSCLVNYLEK